MNKLLVISSLAVALASVNGYSQGTVVFANSSASLVVCSTTDGGQAAARLSGVAGQATPKGTTLTAGLYYAPDGSATAPEWSAMTLLSSTPFSALSAGRFSSSLSVTTPATTAPGAPAWFGVRAWETSFGNYDASLNGGGSVGNSSIFKLTTGAAGAPPTPLSTALQGFSVSVVPEPSALALGIIGLAGLFIIRRRQ